MNLPAIEIDGRKAIAPCFMSNGKEKGLLSHDAVPYYDAVNRSPFVLNTCADQSPPT